MNYFTRSLVNCSQGLRFYIDVENETTTFQRAIFALDCWIDDYLQYGMVVGFDPKAKVNRFNLPCVAFVGMNPAGM